MGDNFFIKLYFVMKIISKNICLFFSAMAIAPSWPNLRLPMLVTQPQSTYEFKLIHTKIPQALQFNALAMYLTRP